ncbi:hypothetical protein RH858_08085 [Halalkaliarchaeum sp. AArc-GB]|uniref:hypothetical protein n=1 Tax=Halalkaliarchaeum sp. AArc-GB TaxID=3074078 RepID=UPI00285D1A9B|nr:hypothetical protein [Halalkaliarchaeum sp. AArc-GB]MDR5673107.1 hypothetical protein [Halalkaliarchaeum sp. AArc-GB]
MSDTSTTFGGWSDRLTWILAEAQLLVLGVLFSIGAALVIYRPDLPTVPPIVVGWIAALLLFGPALFGFFVAFVRRLRQRRMVEVHHVNAVGDTLEKYYVEPGIWEDKKVQGAAPYPVNGSAAWAVQEFEYDEDLDQLRVTGVWLSEIEDTKLLTKKSHMESMYSKLTESHITLNVMRESVSEFGADIQETLVNEGAEARERGTLMDPDAVKDVFENFSTEIEGTGPDDLPTIELEEFAEPVIDEPKTNGAGETTPQEAVTDD